MLTVVAGFRQALLALWGMPVSYLLATLLMWKTGLTINVISTFALLIATGIIVDDAIVVIENTQRHLEMGKDRVRAAIDGTREVLVPVTTAVTTTCLAFLPLTMVGGTIGRVMKILRAPRRVECRRRARRLRHPLACASAARRNRRRAAGRGHAAANLRARPARGTGAEAAARGTPPAAAVTEVTSTVPHVIPEVTVCGSAELS